MDATKKKVQGSGTLLEMSGWGRLKVLHKGMGAMGRIRPSNPETFLSELEAQ